MGDHIDIKIQSVDSSNRPSFTALNLMIEVKGCRHADLLDAIETQLANDYLSEDDQTHGLYVVGWYYTPLWDYSKNGKARGNQKAIDEHLGSSHGSWQEYFDAQAEGISWNDRNVRAVVFDASAPAALDPRSYS